MFQVHDNLKPGSQDELYNIELSYSVLQFLLLPLLTP